MKRGWHLSSQTQVGPLDAVGIYGKIAQETSGACTIEDGSVAFFHGETLVAIAYDPNAGESGSRTAGIGPSTMRDTAYFDDLQSIGGPTVSAVADGRHLAVLPVAELEVACAGRAQLPNVHGKSLMQARKALADLGWKPRNFSAAKAATSIDRLGAYRKEGLTEVEDCSGTGFGYCSAAYTNAAGATLHITTLGEYALRVGDYHVNCFED